MDAHFLFQDTTVLFLVISSWPPVVCDGLSVCPVFDDLDSFKVMVRNFAECGCILS